MYLQASELTTIPRESSDLEHWSIVGRFVNKLGRWHSEEFTHSRELSVSLVGALGCIFCKQVLPQRQIRTLDMVWHLPFGRHHHMQCKPWRWVGHLLGHEAVGSVAYTLKQQVLPQYVLVPQMPSHTRTFIHFVGG